MLTYVLVFVSVFALHAFLPCQEQRWGRQQELGGTKAELEQGEAWQVVIYEGVEVDGMRDLAFAFVVV